MEKFARHKLTLCIKKGRCPSYYYCDTNNNVTKGYAVVLQDEVGDGAEKMAKELNVKAVKETFDDITADDLRAAFRSNVVFCHRTYFNLPEFGPRPLF